MAVLHVVCIDAGRNLWHTTRDRKGNWGSFIDVRDVVVGQHPDAPSAGAFDDLDCAGLVNDLHLGLVTGNKIIHTARRIDGSWTAFEDVSCDAQAPTGTVFSVAVAQANGQLDFCAAIQTTYPHRAQSEQSLFHAIRRSGGSWRSFQNCGGSFSDMACAEAGGMLHFLGVTFDQRGLRTNALEHAVRRAGAATTFTPFEDVRSVVLAQNPGALDPGVFHRVSCAGIAGELHVCVISNARLFHTIRQANGTWLAFDDVVAAVSGQNRSSPRPQGLRSIGCAVVDGDLHVVCVDSGGTPWHAIRRRNGSWLAFGNLIAAVLGDSPGTAVPGSIGIVAVADSF